MQVRAVVLAWLLLLVTLVGGALVSVSYAPDVRAGVGVSTAYFRRISET